MGTYHGLSLDRVKVKLQYNFILFLLLMICLANAGPGNVVFGKVMYISVFGIGCGVYETESLSLKLLLALSFFSCFHCHMKMTLFLAPEGNRFQNPVLL